MKLGRRIESFRSKGLLERPFQHWYLLSIPLSLLKSASWTFQTWCWFEMALCRIARHASGSLSMDLFRVPEDKYQQNIDFLERIIEKPQDQTGIATAVAEVLPQEHIGILYRLGLFRSLLLNRANAKALGLAFSCWWYDAIQWYQDKSDMQDTMLDVQQSLSQALPGKLTMCLSLLLIRLQASALRKW